MARPRRAKDTTDKIRRGIQADDYALLTDEEKRKKHNIIEWITMFRRNWNIYIEYVLAVPLKPFQRIMFWLAGQSDVFFAMMSRGCSKSWWAAGCGLVKILLYPYAEVVITSSTVDQANKLFTTKILNEWILKLSPYLKDMYERGYLVVKQEDDGYKLTNNLNGAWLKVLPCTDSARGKIRKKRCYYTIKSKEEHIMAKAQTFQKWTEEEFDYLRKNYQLYTYKEMGKKLGRTKSSIQNKLKQLELRKPEKYSYNKRFFEVIDTPEKAYWLGFFYADGYVCHSERNYECAIEIKATDFEHLKKLNKDVCGNIEIGYRDRILNGISHRMCSIRFYSVDMFHDLVNNGCIQNKSDKIKLPNLPNNLMWHFVRGFFDGDGCFQIGNLRGKKLPKFDFSCSSISFVNSLREWLYQNGITSYIYQEEKSEISTMPCYRLNIRALENGCWFAYNLYKDATVWLDRKKEKVDNFIYGEEYDVKHRIQHHAGLKKQYNKLLIASLFGDE